MVFTIELYQLLDFKQSIKGEDDGTCITQSAMLIQLNKNNVNELETDTSKE